MAEDTVYLTTGKIQDGKNAGRLLAVLSLGSPQRGDKSVTVLTLEVVDTQAEAEVWFERMKIERPWEARQ